MEILLSGTEAVDYVCSKLNAFDDEVALRRSMKDDRLYVLNKLIREFHFKVPFQNIGLLSKPYGTQDIPTLDEIKTDGLTCSGGLCYTNNVFFCHLLKALGYNVHHISGTCNPKHPNNHIATLAHSVLQSGDKYLVDVGCGYPTLEAVALDFDIESPVYTSIFLKYKFVRNQDGQYERQHLQDFGNERFISLPPSTYSGKWERYYSFDEIPRDLDYFTPAMSEVYQGRFLRKFRVLNFTESAMSAIKELGSQCVELQLFAREDPLETILDNKNKLVCEVSAMLPTYDRDSIELALTHWKKYAVH